MLKNYLKIALRNLKKHKGYSLINVLGLAIGMTCCLLILIWVQDELSYDAFHTNQDRIYRIIQDIQFSDHATSWSINQGPLGPSLKADFAEIEDAVRITWRWFRLRHGEKAFDDRVGLADPSLLRIFSFPLVRGDAASALTNPHHMVISEEIAEKYFGDVDPVGKTLRANNQYDFLITGVFKNIPTNSHLQFDLIVPFVFGRELNYSVDRWNNSQFRTYVMLQEGVPVEEVIQKISNYLDDKPTLEENARLNLQPLTRIHLYSDYEFDLPHGDITYVRVFFIVACFVLLIACINFMNLATARSANRAREVGLRKTVGALRRHLVSQFYGEAMLLSVVALVSALILVRILLPTFNALSGKNLTYNVLFHGRFILGMVIVTLLTGIVSGSYPALYLSAFRPVNVLKGSFETGGRSRSSMMRKILVVTQFVLSIMLIVGTVVVYGQLRFMQNQKLGYDKEHVVTLFMRGNFRDKYETIKSELLRNPGIVNVTATSALPTYGYTFSNSLWRWEGQTPDEEILMRAAFVDYDYFETFKIDMALGRSYSKAFGTDTTDAVIVNETAARVMGMDSPLGKQLRLGDGSARIIGVAKDYHFRSLHSEIEPLILILAPTNCGSMCIRIQGEDMDGTIRFIEEKWKEYESEYPFGYRFLDDRLDQLYRTEQRIGKLIQYFTYLAILISCLGLFGLASFMAEQRTKEIGIRKVLGSSVIGIVVLLSKEFTKWVVVANVIAWPVAYLVMNQWLQSFAYRISLGWWIFVLSGLMALVLAMITVSYQAIKAATLNPVDSLRYE